MEAKNLINIPNNLRVPLWVLSLTFLVFYLTLSYFNRPLTDDLYFYNEFSEKGFLSALRDFRFNIRVTGFFSIYLISNLIDLTNNINLSIFIFQITLISLLVLSIRLGLKTLLKLSSLELSKSDLSLTSFLIVSSYFFFTFQLNEVWYWNAASCIHLLPIPLFVIGFSLLYKPSKSYLSTVALGVCFFLLGGLSETFVINSFTLLTLSVLYSVRKSPQILITPFIKRVLFAALCLSILFVFNVFFSGADIRLNMQHSNNVILNPFFILVHIFIQKKMIIFITYTLIFFFLGKSIHLGVERKFNYQKIFKSLFILNFISFISTFLPLLYVYNHFGPPRSWTPFGFTFVVSILLFSFLIGARNKHGIKWGGTFFSGIAIFLILIYSARQFPIASNYSRAYDDRSESLFQHQKNGNSKAIGVQNLPQSGILIRSTISKDSTDWTNQYLQKNLQLDFPIFLIEK